MCDAGIGPPLAAGLERFRLSDDSTRAASADACNRSRLLRKASRSTAPPSGGRTRRNISLIEAAVPSGGRLRDSWHGGVPQPIDEPPSGAVCATASFRSRSLRGRESTAGGSCYPRKPGRAALFPAQPAMQGAQRGDSEADAALLSRETRAPIRSVAGARPRTARPVSQLATSRCAVAHGSCPAFVSARA